MHPPIDSGTGKAGASSDNHIRLAWVFLKTVGSMLLTLLGLAMVTFVIGRLVPIDPVAAVVGDHATPETYERVFKELGLDQPLWVQFGHYVWGVIHLDFGNALTTGRPVLEDIGRVFPATIELATTAILIGGMLGVASGVIAAMYNHSIIDHLTRLIGLVGHSAPNFWLGLMGLTILYASLGWVGGPGRLDLIYEFDVQNVSGFLLIDTAMQGKWEAFGNVISHLVLPASILAFGAMAYISRMTRSFMLEQLNQEYITTARVKGLSWSRTVWVHAFRNISVQVLTVVALAYAILLEGAVVTETVFAWPGFGRYLTNALLVGDMNAVVGSTLLIGAIFVLLNFICDLLYRLLDPRTR
ncbi:ABC transporter permease [Brucella intermedia]|uniref:ABC transporter permease n=1 Tax=Brucella intermedia TaxID=94625 RepID=UPI00224AEA6D|nr:ABC transporter permease [Brucella intermedia]